MGSEGPSVVTVYVTGFKKFHGVSENPTEVIVGNLKAFMEKRGLPKGLVLGSCTILETAGQGALGQLQKVLESAVIGREKGSSNAGQVIWKVPIVPSDGGITQIRETSLPVNEITKTLAKMGYDVVLSDDAGRFVCNYVYYHSLRFAEHHGIKSLFVHVPLFFTIDEEIHMHFVASLLEVLAASH
ncbi:Pyrrolidone-carboxylate peptidase [Ananas comosus]|uniref:Pyrrolidone-carboxylate peptidase n=1 Tax=Ananas comosus TaxID=4615 RepID=A0A199V8W2_ANACO|nr:Pyrrolidone-carboxylate peptidase [Ananas comosus]